MVFIFLCFVVHPFIFSLPLFSLPFSPFFLPFSNQHRSPLSFIYYCQLERQYDDPNSFRILRALKLAIFHYSRLTFSLLLAVRLSFFILVSHSLTPFIILIQLWLNYD